MNFLRQLHKAEAPNISATEWLTEIADWSGLSVSGLKKWWYEAREINPAARKLLALRQHLTPEQMAKVKEL